MLHSPVLTAETICVTDAAVVPTASAVENEAVVVRLGDGRFAAELDAIAEVGRVPSVTRIPGAPGWLAGVANWRGRLLPVLDLRTLLGAPDPRLGSSARLLVLSRQAGSFGQHRIVSGLNCAEPPVGFDQNVPVKTLRSLRFP